MNFISILWFCLVLNIGFQDHTSSVSESAGDVFVCVEVIGVNMLAEDLEVRVISVDGTAQGSEALILNAFIPVILLGKHISAYCVKW